MVVVISSCSSPPIHLFDTMMMAREWREKNLRAHVLSLPPKGLPFSMTGRKKDCLIFSFQRIHSIVMYLLIVFLPLLGSSVAGFFGRFLGSEGTALITTTCVSFSSILSLIAFYEVAPGASACYLRIAPWISSEMFDASWGFFGDREVTG